MCRRREHCSEILLRQKYSISLIDRERVAVDPAILEDAVAAFVRDIAIFNQRACSAPQTIFIERSDSVPIKNIGEIFALQLAKIPSKPGLNSYTPMQIVNVRARQAMDESHEVSLKDVVQSRAIFLTEVDSWRIIIPLLTPKVQTAGLASALATRSP
jgi:hypothetical protein